MLIIGNWYTGIVIYKYVDPVEKSLKVNISLYQSTKKGKNNKTCSVSGQRFFTNGLKSIDSFKTYFDFILENVVDNF